MMTTTENKEDCNEKEERNFGNELDKTTGR
jgi:hypothetical protein